MLDRILIPLTAQEREEWVLSVVRGLLRERRAHVDVLQVLPEEFRAEHGVEGGEERIARFETQLATIAGRLREGGVSATTAIAYGDPATEILGRAQAHPPSLVAMPTRPREGLGRLLLGSVVERVIRRSGVPVLAVDPGTGTLSFRRILVPLDLHPLSAEVLPIAIGVGRIHASEILLVHVVPLQPEPFTFREFELRSPDSIEALLEPHLEVPRRAGLAARTRIAYGDAAEEILKVAREESVDLIATTTHGRRGPARWVLGSVAEDVLRSSPCPLLVVRTAGLAAGPEVAESEAAEIER